MKHSLAQKILQDVVETYDAIAPEFDATRQAAWAGFEDFLEYVKDGDRVLDAGCGNGRLLHVLKGKKIQYTGCDNSAELLSFARRAHLEGHFIAGDLLALPFRGSSFDLVFCIAALHHIPSRRLRSQALAEFRRVLRPGGQVIITNWDRWTLEYFWPLLRATLKKIFGRSSLDFKDTYIPWSNKTRRYYHCFTLGELKRLVRAAGFAIISAGRPKQRGRRNLVVIAKKV